MKKAGPGPPGAAASRREREREREREAERGSAQGEWCPVEITDLTALSANLSD